MKPVLPLTTAMLKVHNYMDMLVNGYYQSSSPHDKRELNQALARFLFSKDPESRSAAKMNLLQNLRFEEDLIQVIPDDFCILPKHMVKLLALPNNVGYDEENYKEIYGIFKNPKTINKENVTSLLIQLSGLMNSRELCHKSHDDNIWIYFTANLDLDAPNESVVRKLTINILYKWAVASHHFVATLQAMLRFLNF
ncbi:CLUMA_CG006462, isoform A [Clunio marinus]|uniref:CLUMA_CG006462, isoform A n=1 Tax=Clunio marinus TaxID=568069 RepID=A0A1J1HYY7_9DIPT|nr:CLUMA_CG006462, isoform A [Clunio marinus]